MLFWFSSLLIKFLAFLTGKYTWTRAGVVFRSMKHPSTRSMLVRLYIFVFWYECIAFFPLMLQCCVSCCDAGINTCLWSADWRIMDGRCKKRRVCLWAAWWRTSYYSWRGLPNSVSMLSCRLFLVITCSYNLLVFGCTSFVYNILCTCCLFHLWLTRLAFVDTSWLNTNLMDGALLRADDLDGFDKVSWCPVLLWVVFTTQLRAKFSKLSKILDTISTSEYYFYVDHIAIVVITEG